MREQSWDEAGGSKCGRCSAAVRGKAKEKVQLRVVPECIIPFHMERLDTAAVGRKMLVQGCLQLVRATLVRLLELVEADPPESWRQVGGRWVGFWGTYRPPRCGLAAVNFPVRPRLPSALALSGHTQSICQGLPGDTESFPQGSRLCVWTPCCPRWWSTGWSIP